MEIAHWDVSASWLPWQIGRTIAESIPPRMNMSCPGCVTLKINTTVRCMDPDGGVVVVGVVKVVDVDPSAVD